MHAVDESKIPSGQKAKHAFIEAMESWDETAADAAVTGLVRSAGAQEIFELFCRYCARDFRELGHKAIYTANSWRALQLVQAEHDRHYHPDVCGLTKGEQLRHYALHLAKIVGGEIKASAWEILLAMVCFEAAFGIAGVIIAPIVYAYMKAEMRDKGLI